MLHLTIVLASMLFAVAGPTTGPSGDRLHVIPVDKVPDITYVWDGSGNGHVRCFGSQCDHYYMPPDDAAPTRDVTLRLILPDGTILVAQCLAKEIPGTGHALHFFKSPAAKVPIRRDCGTPETNAATEASLHEDDIRLTLPQTLTDGTPATEVYHVLGRLAPMSAAGPPVLLPPSSRIVFVSSVPYGAKLFVDGKRAGTAPAQVDLSTLEAHQLTLEKDGFRRVTQIVPAENEQTRFTVRLLPTP